MLNDSDHPSDFSQKALNRFLPTIPKKSTPTQYHTHTLSHLVPVTCFELCMDIPSFPFEVVM